jgi:hypothetical protein
MGKVLERSCFGNQEPKLTREKDRKILERLSPNQKKESGSPPLKATPKKNNRVVGFS